MELLDPIDTVIAQRSMRERTAIERGHLRVYLLVQTENKHFEVNYSHSAFLLLLQCKNAVKTTCLDFLRIHFQIYILTACF